MLGNTYNYSGNCNYMSTYTGVYLQSYMFSMYRMCYCDITETHISMRSIYLIIN